MAENEGIISKLLEIQSALKVEKGTYNQFGDFYYRSKEDILEAVKPLCHERGLVLLCNDETICMDNGAIYVVTTATLTDAATGEVISAKASAREPESKPKMDASQVSGSAASYAGKRALGNLFALDDTKDADSYESQPARQQQTAQPPQANQPFIAACTVCGQKWTFENEYQLMYSLCTCGNGTFARV